MKKIILALALITSTFQLFSQINIIPQPNNIEVGSGIYVLKNNANIYVDDKDLKPSAEYLNEYLVKNFKYKLKKTKKSSKAAIKFILDKDLSADVNGKYRLIVDNDGISIAASTPEGIFYGVQSLIQLIPHDNNSFEIPYAQIEDAPRFEYRGAMLDVVRHFRSTDYIKKYIDYLALHKINYFHWHLTDDQGWRIEIKKYPKLQELAAWRHGTMYRVNNQSPLINDSTRHGGYYTHAQIKEIVAYAASRYITVIPEIEMPGHASAAIAAYPEFSCFPDKSFHNLGKFYGPTDGKQVIQHWGIFTDIFEPNEKVFKFLEDVIDEILPLFPAPYIHIGGDEARKSNWNTCTHCKNLMAENGFKNANELQSYFIKRMESYINSKGKTIIGWDEITEGGLAPNAIVMSWQSHKGATEAVKHGNKAILSPKQYCYLDYKQAEREDSATQQVIISLEKAYSLEPIPTGLTPEQEKLIIGGQANLWTEYIKSDSKVEYMLFPRLSALAEVFWSQPKDKNFVDFKNRLTYLYKIFDKNNINYHTKYYLLASNE